MSFLWLLVVSRRVPLEVLVEIAGDGALVVEGLTPWAMCSTNWTTR